MTRELHVHARMVNGCILQARILTASNPGKFSREPSFAQHVKRRRQSNRTLTRTEVVPYDAIRMTNLIAIAASTTVHLWWRGSFDAARWRD